MRKSNTQPLKDVIGEYLKALDIDNKLLEVRLIDSWPEIVGIIIARKTDRLFIKNHVLFVYLNSSIVRSELFRIREGLIKALNEKVGDNIINEIVLR